MGLIIGSHKRRLSLAPHARKEDLILMADTPVIYPPANLAIGFAVPPFARLAPKRDYFRTSL
jgi:hypothetical protein